MAYMTPPSPLGTFDNGMGDPGLGLRLRRRKKKKAVATTGAPKKRKKKKSLIRRIGKGLLKVAPVAAGIFLPGAGAVAVGAASGLIGRGKPKLRNVLRGAALAGGTKLAVNAIRSGQAGRILVKGKKALGSALRGGGRVVGKLGSGAGQAIENIAKGKIGAKEAAVLGIGGAAVAIAAKKLIKGGGGSVTEDPIAPGDPGHVEPETPVPTPPQLPDEDLPPYPPSGPVDTGGPSPTDEGPGPDQRRRACEAAGGRYDPITGSCRFDPQTGGGTPADADGGIGPGPGGPSPTPSPTDLPTGGGIPTAGGEIPDTAGGALMPGSGGDPLTFPSPYPPDMDADQDGILDSEEDEAKKKKTQTLLIVAGIAAVVLLTRKKRKGT